MNQESHDPEIEPELEARIVALVLGEASDFERDELNRLIENSPDLAAFRKQMQSVHGLLQDVGAGESVAKDDEWKLSAEKRDAVLAVIRGEANEQPAVKLANKPDAMQHSVKGSMLWNLTKIAALFCIVGFFGSLLLLPAVNSVREAARVDQLASNDAETLDSKDLSMLMEEEASSMDGAPSSADNEHLFMDEPTTATWEFRAFPPAEENALEFDVKENSRSALSAIRGSLGRYASEPAQGVNGPGPGPPTPSAAGVAGFGGGSGESAPSAGDVKDQLNALSDIIRDQDEAWEVGGITRDTSRRRMSVSGEGEPASGEDQELAAGEPALFGGTNLQFPTDLAAPETDGEETDSDGIIAAGKDLDRDFDISTHSAAELELPGDSIDPSKSPVFMNGFDAAGTTLDLDDAGQQTGETTFAIPEDSRSEKIAQRDSSIRLDAAESPEAELSTSLSTGIRNRTANKEAEMRFGRGYAGTELVDPTPRSVDQPMSLIEDLEHKRKPAGELKLEEFAKGSNAILSDGGVLLLPSLTPEDKAFYSRQIIPSAPVTGTAIGQPAGESQNGRAKQDAGWAYRKRVEDSLGEISALTDLEKNVDAGGESLPDAYYLQDDVQYWHRPESKLRDEQGRMERQADEVAISGQNLWGAYVPPALARSKSLKSLAAKRSPVPAGLNEKNAEDEAFSTFSLHVSDVSFKLARAALARGEWPEAAKVRIEEFVNAFDYGDPMPSQNEKVACRLEQCIHPFLQQRNLLRVSMRTAAAGRSSDTPLRLTFLLDNSGSMERIDRQQTVRRAFALLAQQLKPTDQVTLISFARQPRLLADKISGDRSRMLVELIRNLPSEGGTNIEAALQLGFEKAREQQIDDAQNRIVLLTDGAVNLGDANPDSLSRMITTMRHAGIAFDAAGISAEGLNDEVLEALTRQGDGRYYLLDSVDDADDGFAQQIAGALRPSAKNVKVQIEFNPKRVGRYKLLGFEKHRLKQEDFRNDQVDAAEMAAAEAGVAVYQFQAKPDGEGDVGSVSVRFRDLSTGQMIENRWPIPYEADAPRDDQAAPPLRIAIAAALLAAKLRGEPLGATVDLKWLSNLVAGLPDRDRDADRVQQLQMMIQQARQLSGD